MQARSPGARKRILYAWQLGNGIGHLMRFLPLALELRARGHDVVWAVRDLREVETVVVPHRFTVVQAPFWHASRGEPQVAAMSYGELVLRHGFGSAEGLAGLVRGWRGLCRFSAASLLIADHAPAALLAAHTLGLDTCTIGHGFFTPPALDPTPNMQPWVEVGYERLREADARALGNANQVIAALGGAPLARLADLFRVNEQFLTTFAELDHYPQRKDARYWGAVCNVEEGAALDWPAGDGPRVFAYLKPGQRDFEQVLGALRALSARALVYAPGIARERAARVGGASITISAKPIRLTGVREACDAAVCHGGPGTVAAMLLAGVPLLLIPTQAEQFLSAQRVAALDAGLVVSPLDEKAPDYLALLRRLAHEPRFRNAARAFADRYRSFDLGAQATAMAERVDQILAAPRTREAHAG